MDVYILYTIKGGDSYDSFANTKEEENNAKNKTGVGSANFLGKHREL